MQASSNDESIWRYLTIEKFISMLTSEALWFTRASEFTLDPHEAYTDVDAPLDSRTGSGAKQIANWLGFKTGEFFASAPNRLYVNCWFRGPDESFAMWRAYSSLEAGIAIRSSVYRFLEAVDLGKRAMSRSFTGPSSISTKLNTQRR